MREILFRAKRIDNGEWVTGDLIQTAFIKNETEENIPYILDVSKADYDCFEDLSEENGIFEVDQETICEYMGLTDKNGRKIFEGDILSGERYHDWGQGGEYLPDKCVIRWNDKRAAFDPIYWWEVYNHDLKNYEVIGNIFDNK